MQKPEIRDYFGRIAPVWDHWHRRNRYYHAETRRMIGGMVPPGSAVLEIGCGTGDLLASLRPSEGVGLNVHEDLTERARARHPAFRFLTADVDEVPDLGGFRPEYIVLNNMLDYTYDLWDLFEALRPLLDDRTLLVATTSNPLWAPVLRTAGRLGLRVPGSPRNFVTNKDIASVLSLQGFQVVEEAMALPLPAPVPLLAPVLNAVVPEIPAVRLLASVQRLVARLPAPRGPLFFSVVVPCHNEEDNVLECVRRVPFPADRCEILVVDDGSTDSTRARALEAMGRDTRVRLIACDRNRGKSQAVRAGFQAARGDALVILDADMAVAPEELPKFLRPLEEGRCDFVNGARFIYPMQGKAMKAMNWAGNKGFCFLVSWVIRQRVSDTLCGTKALLRRDFLRIAFKENEKWGDFGLLFGAARLKLRMLEVPVHYQERRAGKSKMRVLKDGWLFLLACLEGWRTLRFPETRPWNPAGSRVEGWREIRPEARPDSSSWSAAGALRSEPGAGASAAPSLGRAPETRG